MSLELNRPCSSLATTDGQIATPGGRYRDLIQQTTLV